MALGIAKNYTNVNSDCFLHTDRTVANIEGLVQSFYDIYIFIAAPSWDDLPPEMQKNGLQLFSPVQWVNTMQIEVADLNTACDFKNIIKQVSFRTQTYSGVQDVMFVLLSAFVGPLGKYDPFFKNELYDALEILIASLWYIEDESRQLTCAEFGFATGLVPAIMMNYKSPQDVYLTNVNTYHVDSTLNSF